MEYPPLNLYEHFIAFWKLDIEYLFNANETRLYFALFEQCRSLVWKNPFTNADGYMAEKVGISVNTLKTSRNRLQQVGLISFKPGGNGARDKGVYTLMTMEELRLRYHYLIPYSKPYTQPYIEPNPPKVDDINSNSFSLKATVPEKKENTSSSGAQNFFAEPTGGNDGNHPQPPLSQNMEAWDRITEMAILAIQDCKICFLQHRVCSKAKEVVIINRHIPVENADAILDGWLDAFNELLVSELVSTKQLRDYSSHFGRWLKIVYKPNTDPKQLSDVPGQTGNNTVKKHSRSNGTDTRPDQTAGTNPFAGWKK